MQEKLTLMGPIMACYSVIGIHPRSTHLMDQGLLVFPSLLFQTIYMIKISMIIHYTEEHVLFLTYNIIMFVDKLFCQI